ncbi:MAG: response regulator [Pseudomonadales bacterium]|nr:response regulator [Pseudomonadales bacterium]
MQSLNIMVVDDSSITIKKLSFLLENLGHHVVDCCINGDEAITHFDQVKPDLVTMDITMPEVNGIEATRDIIRHHPDAKIIMVTSHGQEKMVMDAIEAGACGYVLKPFKEEKLDDAINKVMH